MKFAGHSLLGLLAGAIAALGVAAVAPTTLEALSLPFIVPATVLVLVYLGAVYPDVDVHRSIPRQTALPYLQAAAVGGAAVAAYTRWEWFVAAGEAAFAVGSVSAEPSVAGGIALLAGGVLGALAVEPVLGILTGPHRTWTHSVGVHVLGAAALAVAVWLVLPMGDPDRFLVAGLPFAFALGVAVHRFADSL